MTTIKHDYMIIWLYKPVKPNAAWIWIEANTQPDSLKWETSSWRSTIAALTTFLLSVNRNWIAYMLAVQSYGKSRAAQFWAFSRMSCICSTAPCRFASIAFSAIHVFLFSFLCIEAYDPDAWCQALYWNVKKCMQIWPISIPNLGRRASGSA